jgi:hypothetical protein
MSLEKGTGVLLDETARSRAHACLAVVSSLRGWRSSWIFFQHLRAGLMNFVAPRLAFCVYTAVAPS